MTANEMDFTAAERAALDRVTVPAMRAGFASDLVAGATSGARVPPRRSARGGWRAHGRVLLGAGALVLASATAAATGWFGKLPIAIPGISRAAPVPEIRKPHRVVHVEKPKPNAGHPEALAAAMPQVEPMATPPARGQWRARRQARIAAGLPVRRPLVRRALMAEFRSIPRERRQAAVAEWRRIKALPPPERKAAIARLKGDFLATHPRVAAQVEQRLERKSALAASAGDPVKPGAGLPAQPGMMPGDPGPRALTPEQRFERRQALRQWRMQRRARRLQAGQPMPDEGQGGPVR